VYGGGGGGGSASAGSSATLDLNGAQGGQGSLFNGSYYAAGGIGAPGAGGRSAELGLTLRFVQTNLGAARSVRRRQP
jgi:hypothetical protein